MEGYQIDLLHCLIYKTHPTIYLGEVDVGCPSFSKEDRIHLGEELADCMLYLCRLSDVCGINLSQAVKDKMIKNAKKYPPNLCKRSAKKYTHYTDKIKNDNKQQ